MLSSSPFQDYFNKAVLQGLAIVMVAAGIGFSTNMFRADGLALVGNWSAKERIIDESGVSLVISLPEAKKLYHENKALFLDARDQSLFDAGHIRGPGIFRGMRLTPILSKLSKILTKIPLSSPIAMVKTAI